MKARAANEAATLGTRLGQLRIQQLCPSIDEACGVGNFASNLETAIRKIGVDLRSTSSLIDTRIGDLLVQHEFGLFDTWVLKRALKLHVGRRILFAHSPGAEVFSKDVDAFVSLCEGTIRTDIPRIVLPHPGWQSPLRNRHELKCQFGWSEYDAVVGTNGFMNSTRQFVEIVSRFIEFAVKHNVLIFVACPRHYTHHDNSEYMRHERLLLSIAESYPRNLRIEQAFLDQDALNLRLQACDLLWCWTGSPSAAYGSGTCSDQYASGTRLVVTKKQQHSQVFGLPGTVLGATDIDSFVATLKNEVLNANFDRHDPSPLSWESFSTALRDFLLTVPRRDSSNRHYAIDVPKSYLVDNESSANATGQFRVSKKLGLENAAIEAGIYLNSVEPIPNSFSGRGIVICAGGRTYNTCAWVLIRLLRFLGCELPIEVWSYESEYDPEWKALVEPLQVVVRYVAFSASESITRYDGWKLKSTAILKSAFREVLLLDADNVPVQDPSYLFDCPEYQESGAVFWPDCERTRANTDQWLAFGVPYRDEPEQESGQILVDKAMSWRPLNLCAWYNANADFFYSYVYGDKDTFRLAWHRCNSKFAMPSKGVGFGLHTMLQYDFEGRLIFQHRYGDKWNLKRNRVSPGFVHEDKCFEFVEELRQKWQPVDRARILNQLDPTMNLELTNRAFRCALLGHSIWNLRLDEFGVVDVGRTSEIEGWWMRRGQLVLGTIEGAERYVLDRTSDGSWRGAGPNRTQLELTPEEYNVSK